jgi:hypothetical protein
VGCIQMQYVSTASLHGLLNTRGGLVMCPGQVCDKLASQVFYFRKAQVHISNLQITANLIGCSVALKQTLSHKNKNIPANITMPGNQPAQNLRSMYVVALLAKKQRFVGNKRPRHTQHLLATGL